MSKDPKIFLGKVTTLLLMRSEAQYERMKVMRCTTKFRKYSDHKIALRVTHFKNVQFCTTSLKMKGKMDRYIFFNHDYTLCTLKYTSLSFIHCYESSDTPEVCETIRSPFLSVASCADVAPLVLNTFERPGGLSYT